MPPLTPDQDVRRRETGTEAWLKTTPQVSVNSVCPAPDECAGGFGVDWDERDLYVEFGEVPTTLDAALALVARAACDACGRPHTVYYFSVFASDADGGDELISWVADE